MAVAQRCLTLEEFLSLPERKPALEFEDGVVTQKPMPGARHGRLQGELAARLDSRRRIALVAIEASVTFAGRSYVPDVIALRRERVPVGPDGLVADDLTIAPDIAGEIVSPNQSVTSLIRKCLWYVANGVRIALLVDDEDRSVLVFRPSAEIRAVRGNDSVDASDVLPGCRFTARRLFDSLKV